MEEPSSHDFEAEARLLAASIDHTVLEAHASTGEISYACREAAQMGCAAICVSPAYVAQARSEVNGRTKVAVLIGHPFGLSLPVAKAYEAEVAVKEGAQEVDLVLGVGWLREGDYAKTASEIEMVRRAIGPEVLLKATLLFDLLDDDSKVAGVVLCLESSCDYVVAAGEKLSHRDIYLIHDITRGEKGIKASGPLKDWKMVEAMLGAGMTRLGTAWGAALLKAQRLQWQQRNARWA
jgi:deoxyribose-phosphate aldolase